jgi:hypothetical protein
MPKVGLPTDQTTRRVLLEALKLRGKFYVIAFLQNDVSGMKLQTSWGSEKPGVEDWFMALEADTSAYSGKLREARELSRRAVATASGSEEKETAAIYESYSAVRESLMGNPVQARQHVAAALRLSRGRDVMAAAEFQKILDHPGVVQNEVIGALAHLGLARAYAMQKDTPRARASYHDFLTLWKDADPGIPILKQAQQEYAKLQ